jgi:competence protein ComEA
MTSQKKSAGQSLRAIWIGILLLGGGLIVASTASLFPSVFAQQSSQGSQAQTAPAPPPSSDKLPEGPGKATFVRVCSKCHTPTIVLANGQDRQGWEDTITKMSGLGAAASDEEFTDILEYLSKNFPPVTAKVNMNKATANEIESQLGFTAKQAGDIVAYREKNGDFKTSDDLKKVPQMEAKDVDLRRNRMTF